MTFSAACTTCGPRMMTVPVILLPTNRTEHFLRTIDTHQSGRQDLNLRSQDPQSCAIPSFATPCYLNNLAFSIPDKTITNPVAMKPMNPAAIKTNVHPSLLRSKLNGSKTPQRNIERQSRNMQIILNMLIFYHKTTTHQFLTVPVLYLFLIHSTCFLICG